LNTSTASAITITGCAICWLPHRWRAEDRCPRRPTQN